MRNTFKLCIFLSGIWFFTSCESVEIPENIAKIKDNLPEKIDYNIHIKPIISDRCFKCHGPDKNKIEAGLQLANQDGATSKLKSGNRAIVAGNINESELVKRILSHDPEEMMPTPKSNLSLSDEEKAMLIKWIEQGAEYKEHWAYVAPKMPNVPKIGTFFSRLGFSSHPETDWATNEIDNFVIEKLNEKGLKFSPKADKATLLRRISLDLTGLPPTVAEVDAFLNDKSENAYEKAVDNLLKSPHFGENFATSWLDLARYADTHGYQDDGFRDMYPYRDWVIRQFNQNLPFDKFVTWQIAGDLVEKPNRETILATAFNRNHQQSQEGGIVPQEYYVEYVADRVNTFGKAFLGLTTECARCHDHKYDPISQKDYYSMFAFFNTNNEYGQIPYNGEPSPSIILTDEEADCDLNFIKNQLKPFDQKLNFSQKNYQIGFNKWLNQAKNDTNLSKWDKKGLVGFWNFEKADEKGRFKNSINDTLFAYIGEKKKPDDVTPEAINGKIGKGLRLIGDSQISLDNKIQTKFERNQPFSVALWLKNEDFEKEKYLFCNTSGPMDGFRGYQVILDTNGKIRIIFANVWPDNAIEIETKEKLPLNQWTHITLTYDGNSQAAGLKLYFNNRLLPVNILNDKLTRSMNYGKERRNWGGRSFMIGRMSDQAYKNYSVDELYIFKKALNSLEISSLYKNSDEIKLAFSDAKINSERQNLLKYYIENHDSTYSRNFRERQKLIKNESNILTDAISVMVMRETPHSQARKSHILKRGAYDAPDKEVKAEFMSKFNDLADKYPQNRLGLAQWLLDEENPLFARVAVNRFWIQFFGNGLVKTQEDFGNQGDMPSHPELLDWLALQFREDEWDTKKFIKRIVMSSTYQQSSVANKNLLETDPENKWLARGASYRLSAEQVRDNALAASGLLNRKIGGKYVFPYQPSGIWEALATRNGTVYVQSKGDSIYRRSLYTIWKRSAPPPMMLNFDVPERSFCTVRRQKTSTPLQALVTMNDPQFVEASRVLAERVVSKSNGRGENSELRTVATVAQNSELITVFKSIISRPPRAKELALMKKMYEEEYQDFQKNPKFAEELLSIGEFPRNKNLNSASVAAMTMVCNTLFNYDEAAMKR